MWESSKFRQFFVSNFLENRPAYPMTESSDVAKLITDQRNEVKDFCVTRFTSNSAMTKESIITRLLKLVKEH